MRLTARVRRHPEGMGLLRRALVLALVAGALVVATSSQVGATMTPTLTVGGPYYTDTSSITLHWNAEGQYEWPCTLQGFGIIPGGYLSGTSPSLPYQINCSANQITLAYGSFPQGNYTFTLCLAALPCPSAPVEILPQVPQTINFTSTPPSNATVGGATYTVMASGGASGIAVTLSVDPSATSVCTISASVVSDIGIGTCEIDANQSGNTEYSAAQQATQSFPVGGIPQAITFTSSAPSDELVGGPHYTVSASGGGSGNPIVFSIDSSTTTVCRISGSVVSFTGIGTCQLNASQAGDAQYLAAYNAQSVPVGGTPQTITFTSSAPSHAVVGGPTYDVSASGGGSGNPVMLSVDPLSRMVCSISGPLVSFTGIGTCIVDASQAGNTQYLATSATQGFAIGGAFPAITSADGTTTSLGVLVTFTVHTTGSPVPKLKERGKLPKGVKFHDNHDGTGTLSGTPASTKHKSAVGTYPITITATFGKGKARQIVTQDFTLTIIS
jgi:hypothetical protein